MRKRRVPKERGGWTANHREQLCTGFNYFSIQPGGFGPMLAASPFDRFIDPGRADVRRAWSELGPSIVADWIREHPATRPWAFWVLEIGRPDLARAPVTAQSAHLAELGLLTDSERSAIAEPLQEAT